MASSGNFPLWSPLIKGATNLSLGNTRFDGTTNSRSAVLPFTVPTGTKFYVECLVKQMTNYNITFGLVGVDQAIDTYLESQSTVNGMIFHGYSSGDWRTQALVNGSRQGFNSLSDDSTATRVLGMTINTVDNEIKMYIDNTLIGNGTISISATQEYRIFCSFTGGAQSGVHMNINCGHDASGAGDFTSGGGNADENGFGDFQNSPPSGFLALCSANLPISDDIDPAQTDDDYPSKQFNAITWTGNRTSNSTVNNITGVGFQPDLVWLKILNNTYDHRLVDSSRGVTEAIRSNQTTAEQTEANGLYQFGSDGFSVKGDNNYNSNGDPFIGYCWRANGGTTASNSDGDITSTVQANTNAGFSIVTYTGDNTDHRGVGYGSANIGHGLDSAPEFIITKRRNASASWYVLHASAGVGYLTLNSSLAFQSGAVPFGPALPTTTTFCAYSANNISGATYINYCWHSVEGYSKFGLFEGNADNNGPFIYTGFRPRLLFIKNMDSSSAWGVYDGERPGFNDCDLGAWDETTGYNNNIGTYPCDILSNGFKLKTSNSTVNSSHTWVYGAWGDVPFKYNNTF